VQQISQASETVSEQEIDEKDKENDSQKPRRSVAPISRVGIPGTRKRQHDENNQKDQKHVTLLQAEGGKRRTEDER
jgi:hypothetical protein